MVGLDFPHTVPAMLGSPETQLDDEIRARIQAADFNLDSFETWFVSHTWDIRTDFVIAVDHLLIEQGLHTPAEIHAELVELAHAKNAAVVTLVPRPVYGLPSHTPMASVHPLPGRIPTGRAGVVGLGLIGASIGLALRQQGWWVTGYDIDEDHAAAALRGGVLDEIGMSDDAQIIFIATPPAAALDAAQAALASGAIVTDVTSVKGPIVEALGHHPNFIGGHPMAGNERGGLLGADPRLFSRTTWVLCPTDHTDDETLLAVRGIVVGVGAQPLLVPAALHDQLVAVVSHVPHLVAGSLMRVAADHETDNPELFRLAAGGFRDMTRIAAGHPGIWPEICVANQHAILEAFDALMAELGSLRDAVAAGNETELFEQFEAAHLARRRLPGRVLPDTGDLANMQVLISDEAGALTALFVAISRAGINIEDVEMSHNLEGRQAVVTLAVGQADRERLYEVLAAGDWQPTVD